jgi:hypothetical protein
MRVAFKSGMDRQRTRKANLEHNGRASERNSIGWADSEDEKPLSGKTVSQESGLTQRGAGAL